MVPSHLTDVVRRRLLNVLIIVIMIQFTGSIAPGRPN